METKNKTNSKELVLNYYFMEENYLRLIDANLNRLREGIRVVEDIFRYVYNDKQTALKLKELRHLSRLENYIELLETRDVKNDVLRSSIKSEQNRTDLYSILIANFKRAQESSRVLEEFTKLTSIKEAFLKYFTCEFETIMYKLEFDNKKDLFDYIKKSGVSGANESLDFKNAKKLYKEYNINYLEFEVIFVKTISKL